MGILVGFLQYTLMAVVFGLPAVILHELGHVAAAYYFGVKVRGVKLKWYGVGIIREPGTDRQNALVSFSGPAFNLLLALASWYHPNFFVSMFFWSNIFLGAVNLLPIKNSDGARILSCLERINNPPKAL